jgi:tetraacyldisaccharide 4'-kinase
VISVGNIAVGGRGKTPTVAAVARLLAASGERPSILSRGYARTQPEDGVVVVSGPEGLRADLARSGDEPLMLARSLPGVPILVSEDRYLAGLLAEHHFGTTVHILDDGFQHLVLDRDVDLVIVSEEDLDPAARTLPSGRLREPADALVAADAVLSAGGEPRLPSGVEAQVFVLRRTAGDPLVIDGQGDRAPLSRDTPIFVVAAIAGPSRFFGDLRDRGWAVSSTQAFRDHHAYSRADVDAIWSRARREGAGAIVTTEKDMVRLLPFRPFSLPLAYVPLTMEIEPEAEFRRWLEASLRSARDLTLD